MHGLSIYRKKKQHRKKTNRDILLLALLRTYIISGHFHTMVAVPLHPRWSTGGVAPALVCVGLHACHHSDTILYLAPSVNPVTNKSVYFLPWCWVNRNWNSNYNDVSFMYESPLVGCPGQHYVGHSGPESCLPLGSQDLRRSIDNKA